MPTYYLDADSPLRNIFISCCTFLEVDGRYSISFNAQELFKQLNTYRAEALPTGTIIWCLSDPEGTYWRHDVWPEYKGTRHKTIEQIAWLIGRKFLISDWPRKDKLWMEPGMEADDLVAIGISEGHVGISGDKDLDTVPGKRYNQSTKTAYTQSEEDANHFFYTQILTGDSCDGIPGCPGVGPAKVKKILKPDMSEAEMWAAVAKAYEAADVPLETALTYARVLRMKRSLNEPLWNPPEE